MNYEAIARNDLEMFKDMIRANKEAVHPTALVFTAKTQVYVVMEFCNKEEEEIVLQKLAASVRSIDATAVILFGTAMTFIPAYGPDPTPLLFASIFVPGKAVYTIGQPYTVIEGEPIFGEEFNSSEKNISPWQVPAFWETTA
jgi:hypothetical protein